MIKDRIRTAEQVLVASWAEAMSFRDEKETEYYTKHEEAGQVREGELHELEEGLGVCCVGI